MEIMKAVIDVSHFINEFVNKGRFSTFFPIHIAIKFNRISEQFGAAQTHSKLDEHREHFVKLRKDFESTLLLQIASSGEETAGGVKKLVQTGDEQSECKLVAPDVDV